MLYYVHCICQVGILALQRRGAIMALAGTLRQMSLEEVLHLIDEERRAGLLLIKNGNLSASLHLEAGQILCVERSGIGQSFSERLINARLVTPSSLAMYGLYMRKGPLLLRSTWPVRCCNVST